MLLVRGKHCLIMGGRYFLFAGSVLGDLIAQYAADLPFDVSRNLRLSVYGLLVGGPSGHFWHMFLDSKIMPKRPQSLAAVFTKLAADQLLFAPISTAIFLAYLKTAEGYPSEVFPFLQVCPLCHVMTW
jgi:hypothetical protein